MESSSSDGGVVAVNEEGRLVDGGVAALGKDIVVGGVAALDDCRVVRGVAALVDGRLVEGGVAALESSRGRGCMG